mgnify:CR=1 FL=1
MIKNVVININKNIVMLQIMILSVLIINSNIHLPCLPAIQAFYDTSEYTIQIAFIINAFVALFVSFFYGAAADLYGRKPVLLWSLAFFIFGTLLIININTIYFFFLGRIFQSLGDAGGAVVCGVIIGDSYKGKGYARVQAILSIVLALAWAGSPILGGGIFSVFGWQGNFVFILILSVMMIIPIFFWQDKKRIKKQNHSMLHEFVKTFKKIKLKFDTYFIMISLLQALPMGLFMAFELMLPFIYKKDYGYSIESLSVFFFIFILINILGSLVYMLVIKYSSLKVMFHIAKCIIISYLILGLYFFTIYESSSELSVYLVFGLLSFSLPFLVISSSTKIVDTYAKQLGIAFALLAIIRNVGTTFIPLLSCILAQNTFHSLFNITLLPTILTVWLFFRILRRR